MDAEEERYLLDVFNRHFKQQLGSQDILWRYAGVRPLCDDESASPSAITRDYTLEVEADAHGSAPLLSVFGGKLTTYRKLGEAALSALAAYFPAHGAAWTRTAPLPGGDIGSDGFDAWQHEVQRQYDWLPAALVARLTDAYGTRVHALLQGCHGLGDMGEHFGAGLYQREVEYMLREEWARSAEDVLWRRSKLGLRFSAEQADALDGFVRRQIAALLSTHAVDEPLRRTG